MTESEDNGFFIPKKIIAAISIIILLLTSLTAVISYGVTMKNDLNNLNNAVDKSIKEHEPIIDRLNDCEKQSIQNQERIVSMHEDITEIKTDIKELLKK